MEAPATSMETATAACVRPASTATMEAATTAHVTTAAVLGKRGHGRKGKQN
jgi:hypothetical protein